MARRTRGHIAQRGRRFYPVVDVGPDPVTGRRRQEWQAGHDTKKAADQALVEILRRLDTGEGVRRSRATVAGFLRDEWLPAIEASIRPGTAALYATVVDAYVVPHIGDHRLQELSPANLTALYGKLLREGGRGGR